MDDKNGDRSQVGLQDQPLDALVEIVEMNILYTLFGQQGIGLLSQHRDLLRQGMEVVLAFDDIIIAQGVSDGLCLAYVAAAIGAGVDFHQSDDIRINGRDKSDYPIQVDAGPFEKTGKR